MASGGRAVELAPGVATHHDTPALIFYYRGRLGPHFADWFLIPDTNRG